MPRTISGSGTIARFVGLAIASILLSTCKQSAPAALTRRGEEHRYERAETRQLVALVDDAAMLIENEGESAFEKLRAAGSRFRRDDSYVFVLDPSGTMLVHPDSSMEGHDEIDLRDVDGRPIVRGLIHAATSRPDAPEGWYHYKWPVPGQILPRWKSSYVRLVTAPSGKRYVVGSGMYDDRMERAFVVDMVQDAIAEIERRGEGAFTLFRNEAGRFRAKESYVFVIDPNGVELVNPAFPNLERRSVLDVRDTEGKPLVREMLRTVERHGSGWVDYMWPKPGDSVSTRKSTYVSRAEVGGRWFLVGCGVYLADAPRSARHATTMTAPELMALVRDAATVFASRGESAYPEFRQRGSKWFTSDTYFFVWTMDGRRVLHAADPSLEGRSGRDAEDILGRPYGTMFLDVGQSASGEGWVHYMYPEPGGIFPRWKSTFLKRVTFPSGTSYVIGAGVYDMKMDRSFVEDVVDRAAALVAQRGRSAFGELRDPKGRFRFMDVYVFVDALDGTELVNPAQPSFEGRNILDLRDARGRTIARDYIAAASRDGSAWVEYDWYAPGDNRPATKRAYVRRVQVGPDVYFVGSGLYADEAGSDESRTR